MHAACVSVSFATTRYCPWEEREVGPQMNKFEQVSSDHHQMMSLAGEGVVGGGGMGMEEGVGRTGGESIGPQF